MRWGGSRRPSGDGRVGMRKTVLLVASVALAVLLASGVALAQTTPPEHLYYEFAGKWSVSGPERIAVDSRDNIYVLAYPGVRKFTSDGTFVKAWSVECA